MEAGKGNKRLFSDLAYEQQLSKDTNTLTEDEVLLDPNGPQSDKRPRAADWPLTSNRVTVQADDPKKRNILEHSLNWDEPLLVPKTQPRSSRFVEGSMNNRQSAKPPPVFLGNTTPEPKERLEPESPKTPFYARSIKKLKRQMPHPEIPIMGQEQQPAAEDTSTMFKFGKSIAAAFNPAKWKIFLKGQHDDKKADAIKPQDYKSQAEFDAAYQAVKANGFIKGSRPAAFATPHKSVTQATIEGKYGKLFPATPGDRHASYAAATNRRPSILDPDAFGMPTQLDDGAGEDPETMRPIFTAKEMESHKKIFEKVNDLEMKLSLARQELAVALRTPSGGTIKAGRRRQDSDDVPPVPSMPSSNPSDEAVFNTDTDSPTRIGKAFTTNERLEQSRTFSETVSYAPLVAPGPGPYERDLIAAEAQAIAEGRPTVERRVRTTQGSKSSRTLRDASSSRQISGEKKLVADAAASSSAETIIKEGVRTEEGAIKTKVSIEIYEDSAKVAKADVLESNAKSFEKARKVSKKSVAGSHDDLDNTVNISRKREGDELEPPKVVKKRDPGDKSAKPKSRIPRRGDTIKVAGKASSKDGESMAAPSTEVAEVKTKTLRRTKSSQSLRPDNQELATHVATSLLNVPLPSLAPIEAHIETKRRKSAANLKENEGGRAIKQPRSFDNSRPSTTGQEKASEKSARSRSKVRSQREMSPTREAFEWGPDVF